MTTIDTGTPLGEIVDLVPGSARVLNARGLDFCCGGARTLGDATRERGIDPAEVLAALERLEPMPSADWVGMDPAALVEHIETTHHSYLWSELCPLDALAQKVATVHGARHPEVLDVRDDVQALRAELEPHLSEEEQDVFPMIRRMFAVDASEPVDRVEASSAIAELMADHDGAGELLARMRRDAREYVVPEDGCASYRALYEQLEQLEADVHMHVHKENNLLFPAVLARVGSATE